MSSIKIVGGKKLSGVIEVGGAKNSAVALIPAAILCNGKVELDNVPNISDIESLKEQVYCKTLCNEEIDWLKSLKERYTWRPSDEQTEALDGICSYIRNQADWEISQDTIHQLYSLSEQLKKLKG